MTVDVVVLTVVRRDLHVVLVRRHGDPYAGSWALPGGFKTPRRDARGRGPARAARGGRHRRARARSSSSAPTATPAATRGATSSASPSSPSAPTSPSSSPAPTPPTPACGASPTSSTARVALAFDHHRIVDDALDHAADRLQDSDLATAFVGPEFTLTELRSVYEAVWGEPLDAANFRRSLALDAAAAVRRAARRTSPSPAPRAAARPSATARPRTGQAAHPSADHDASPISRRRGRSWVLEPSVSD